MSDTSAATPRPDVAAERAARMMLGLEWLMVPVVVALGFLLASFAVRNGDFWQHLATGRLIAEGKYEFGKDPFSYATEGRTWINHAWLSDFLLYQTYRLNESHSAVVYVKAALAALLALVMLLACRPDPEQTIAPGARANPTGWIAAVAVSVALIALSPRLLVQPTLVSFLFFGITFWVLRASRTWPAAALPITLGVLFALWVNCDQWFFLGPALVAVSLIGEVLQGVLPGEKKVEPTRLKLLAVTLAVGLAACLLNPHHVRAFTVIPTELHPNIVESMVKDRLYHVQFISTSNIIYRDHRELGDSWPGWCYWALMGLGVVGFGLNYQRVRWPLVLTWVGCAALPLAVNFRLVPFFAVVGAPIAVLNIHAFFAARAARAGRTVLSPENAVPPATTPEQPAAGAPASTAITGQAPAEAWWPGAAESAAEQTVAAPPSPVLSREAPVGGSVTPETMLAVAGVMGRVLTIVAGLALLALTYPGWLHAPTPPYPRRLAWEVAPEPGYVQLAQRLAAWRHSGQLPADARGLALNLNVANYCCWYAPEVRSFMDYRFPLLGDLSADFMTVRRGLRDWSEGAEGTEDWAAVLRRRGIGYVILTETETGGGEPLLGAMLVDNQQWALWFQNGRTETFGWHDPAAPRHEDPLRLDLVRMAFGAQAERIPPGETFGVARQAVAEHSPERTLLDRYLTPPPPPPPAETMAANVYWQMHDRAAQQTQVAANDAFPFAFSAAIVGFANTPGNLLAVNPPVPEGLLQSAIQAMAQASPLPEAIGLLMVREARLGALAHPNEAYPYLILGMAYDNLPAVSARLRPLQQVCTLHQALARLTPEQIEGPAGPMVSQALGTLFNYHRTHGELDLAEEAMSRAAALFDNYPPPSIPPTQRARQKELLTKNLEAFHNDLQASRDNFQITLDDLRQRNRPLQQQVGEALRAGLVREALALLEKSISELELPNLLQLIQIYLTLGRVEDAAEALDRVPDAFGKEFAGVRRSVLVASGEYARAGKLMEEDIATQERTNDPNQPFIIAALVFHQCHFACVEPAAQSVLLGMLPWGLAGHTNLVSYARLANALESRRSEQADLHAMRAMLALEEGDLPTARKYFRSALAIKAPFEGNINAQYYLRFLDEEAGK